MAASVYHGDDYVAASVVAHLHDLMASGGYPAQEIFGHAGLSRATLATTSRLPLEDFARLLRSAVDITGEPQLLLKLSQVTFTTGFGVVGYLAQSCPTLQDALQGLIRYGLLISNVGRIGIDHRPGAVLWTLALDRDDPVLVRQGSEYFFGVSYRFMLLVDARRSDIVREIRFAHPPPSTPGQLAAYTQAFSCPVRFDAGENAMVLAPHALTTSLRLADVTLKPALEQQAGRKLDEIDSGPLFPQQVRQEIETMVLQRQVSRETLARRLGMSSRHLGRRLADTGIAYQELLDEVRMKLARDYLRDPGRTTTEIGELLGFRDSQSFYRWFRTRAGITPGEFRTSS